MRTLLFILLLPGCFLRFVSAGDLLRIPENAPWGQVEMTEIYLHPRPIPDLIPVITRNSGRWIFPVKDGGEMVAELAGAGISMEWIQRIHGLTFLQTGLGLETRPSESFLLEIPMDERGRLYQYLTRVEYDFSPFWIATFIAEPERMSSQIADRFSPELAVLFERLLWKDGHAHYFSDFHILFSRLPDDLARAELNSLLREWKTYIGSLTIPGATESVAHAEAFWGANGANPGGRNLVQSCVAAGNSGSRVESIDITQVLPPMPRKLLQSFPPIEMVLGKNQPDCFWTALNFFNEDPSDRVYDFSSASLLGLLKAEYDSVQGAGMLGDVIVLNRIDGDGRRKPVHACNYLFEDWVYTKNGKSLQSPWIISRWSDLLTIYQKPGEGFEVERFRLKEWL